MTRSVEVIEGKVRYDGRTLAEWVPQVVADLIEAAHPLKIILFGSVARGDDGPDSDIDILVVLSRIDPASRHELMGELRASIKALIPIDVLVTDPGKSNDGEMSSDQCFTGHCVKDELFMNDLPENNQREARRWLGQAFDDLESARHQLTREDLPARLACFLAHLAD